MRKYLLIALLVLALAIPAFAAVGTKNHGSSIGTATDIDFSTNLTATSDGSTTTVVGSGSQTITGGTINGAVIGGTSPAAGTFTTLVATGGTLNGVSIGPTNPTVANFTSVGAITPGSGAFTTLSASSGINSTNIGAATPGTGKFSTLTTTGATLIRSNLVACGVYNGAAVSLTTANTAVPVVNCHVRKEMSVAGQAGTLANGISGQMLSIYITDSTGGGTFVLTPTTKTGFTSLTFTAKSDNADLLYIDDSTGWVIIGQSGSVTVQY